MTIAQSSVLYVEDDPMLARSLARDLRDLSWQVETAASLSEAQRVVSKRRFDALVVDLQLPDGDGVDLVRHLAHSPQAPRVSMLVSGQVDVQAAVRAVRAGVIEVMEKPVTAIEVDRKLRQALLDHPPRPSRLPQVTTILGDAPAIRAVREQIQTIGTYPDLPVLVVGETGTGKELVAEAVHRASGAHGAFMPINAAAVPEALFESELFGHEAGAYTGARTSRAGLLELAGGGTVFLDELGEMPTALQPKLLRVLETRTFRRVGGSRDLPFMGRVVSATHRKVSGPDSTIRADLYYRLAGFIINVPSLRERPEDIDVLARHFVADFSSRYATPPPRITERGLQALHAYDWPGNIRELKAVLHQAAVASSGVIGVAELEAVLRSRSVALESTRPADSGTIPIANTQLKPLRDVERQLISDAWESAEMNLSEAARRLGLPRSTLRDKLKRFGIR